MENSRSSTSSLSPSRSKTAIVLYGIAFVYIAWLIWVSNLPLPEGDQLAVIRHGRFIWPAALSEFQHIALPLLIAALFQLGHDIRTFENGNVSGVRIRIFAIFTLLACVVAILSDILVFAGLATELAKARAVAELSDDMPSKIRIATLEGITFPFNANRIFLTACLAVGTVSLFLGYRKIRTINVSLTSSEDVR
jgi:hypothetical protein